MQKRNNATASDEGSGGLARRRPPAFVRFCVFALPVILAGCVHAKANTAVEMPPLDMPAPPPRTVEASEPAQPPMIALPDGPRTNLRQNPPTPPRVVDQPRPADQPKADQPATEPPKTADEPPKPATPPATTLQTTPTQREGEVERRVRTLIAAAYNDLNRVNYQALNADARNQYDTAKRFASQAEDALRARNLVFASNLADKAAGLAAQLPGR
jgi:outer membrane biosynthesis protein TonB